MSGVFGHRRAVERGDRHHPAHRVRDEQRSAPDLLQRDLPLLDRAHQLRRSGPAPRPGRMPISSGGAATRPSSHQKTPQIAVSATCPPTVSSSPSSAPDRLGVGQRPVEPLAVHQLMRIRPVDHLRGDQPHRRRAPAPAARPPRRRAGSPAAGAPGRPRPRASAARPGIGTPSARQLVASRRTWRYQSGAAPFRRRTVSISVSIDRAPSRPWQPRRVIGRPAPVPPPAPPAAPPRGAPARPASP